MSAHRWTAADVTSTARPRRPITSQQTCLPVCSSCVSMFTQRKLCVKTWACWCGHVFVSGAGSVHQQSAASPGPGGLAVLYKWLTSTSPVTSPVTWLYVKDEKTPVKSSSSYRALVTSQVFQRLQLFRRTQRRRKHLNCPSGSAPLIIYKLS